MRTIAIESDTLATGWTVVTARIPPRVCGAPNTGATQRVRELIVSVNPDTFDPLPEAVAEAVKRDALPRARFPPFDEPPPSCEGCIEGLTPNAATLAAIAESYALDDKDDDEGEAIPGYPPGVACNVTGECE